MYVFDDIIDVRGGDALNISIRRARPEDLDCVAEIEAVCFPPAEAASKEAVCERLNAFKDSFLVAESDGRIVGFINGCVTDLPLIRDELYHDASMHIADGPYQTVFGLDVLPEYRRLGIAAMLMERLKADAVKSKRRGMVLTCKEHLVHYYEKFGYVNKGVSASTHGGAVWYDMVLEFDSSPESLTGSGGQ